MPSTRSKLVLDEESFQGLLAAAFTIQQYNDRQGGIDADLSAVLAGAAKTDAPVRKNGTGTNGTGDKGAGANEVGASGVGAAGIATNELRANATRNKITAIDRGTLPAAAVELCRQCGAPLVAAGIPCAACDAEVFRPGERLQRTWATMWTLSQEQGTFPGPGPEQTLAELPLAVANLASSTADLPKDDLIASPEAGGIEAALALPIDINAVAAAGDSVGSELVGPQLKVRFRRADLYLGLSVLVAFVALLWPAASAGRAELTPWERVLVAVGIAEAPASVAEVHYSGDPNIKVWVDTQAALYYCPGDELYGKSPGGHYTTQHDAQLDRFEPALRRACVP
jgi:hypothetical protein